MTANQDRIPSVEPVEGVPRAPTLSTTAPKLRSATLMDVARAAGVSTATVSRALNRPDTVREPVRVRVQVAMEQLHYVPNDTARALASQRSRTLGVVASTLDDAGIARSVAAFQARAEASGYGVLFATCSGDCDRALAQVRSMLARGVEAVVLTGSRHPEAVHDILREHLVPYRHMGAFDPEGDWHGVGLDGRQAGGLVARYLLELGHRRIAMIAGPGDYDGSADPKVAGVRHELVQVGVWPNSTGAWPPDALSQTAWLFEGAGSFDAARPAVRALLTGPARPTALICGNDMLALGAMRECQVLGLSVPAQVSVTGYGDHPWARRAVPALSSIRIPMTAIGDAAAASVLAALAGVPAMPVAIRCKLVVRASTGPVLGA